MGLFPPLTLALITGYCFLSIWNCTRFRIIKVSGYRLIFYSAIIGLVFWAFGEVSIWLAKSLLAIGSVTELGRVLTHFGSKIDPNSPFLTPILGLIYGLAGSSFLNNFSSKHKQEAVAAKRRSNSLYLMILEAIEKEQFIEFVMKDGKVYFGCPAKPIGLESEYVNLNPYIGRVQGFDGSRADDYLELSIVNYQVSLKVEKIGAVRSFRQADSFSNATDTSASS